MALEMPWAFDESVCQTMSASNLRGRRRYCRGISGCDGAIAEFSSTLGSLWDYVLSAEPLFLRLARERFENVVILADAEAAGLAEVGRVRLKSCRRRCHTAAGCSTAGTGLSQ